MPAAPLCEISALSRSRAIGLGRLTAGLKPCNPHDNKTMNNAKQGPMTAYQLREVLTAAQYRSRQNSMQWGTPDTSGLYYRAWLWVTANTLGMEAIPHRGPWEPWELESITQTINNIQDLVALDDPA